MHTFQDSIEIQAPVEICYRYWRDFSYLQDALQDVREIHHVRDNVWRWVILGQYGDEGVWDMELIREVPNQYIAWRTMEGPELDMWIDVAFQKIRADLTRITVTFSIHQPECPIGHVMRDLFGVSEDAVRANLAIFKDRIEAMTASARSSGGEKGRPAGERTAKARQPARPDLLSH